MRERENEREREKVCVCEYKFSHKKYEMALNNKRNKDAKFSQN